MNILKTIGGLIAIGAFLMVVGCSFEQATILVLVGLALVLAEERDYWKKQKGGDTQ